ncbi:hypothetical protein PIB30_074800 [Stylosanthes scabra]|uniref:Uncharacterized protein n=1 Tax=Stylosanthes scabra TaxID=79078 RepID=A0ABU6SR34_9FABA|nr:hypothetical protein [Stylosanthes scabra]
MLIGAQTRKRGQNPSLLILHIHAFEEEKANLPFFLFIPGGDEQGDNNHHLTSDTGATNCTTHSLHNHRYLDDNRISVSVRGPVSSILAPYFVLAAAIPWKDSRKERRRRQRDEPPQPPSPEIDTSDLVSSPPSDGKFGGFGGGMCTTFSFMTAPSSVPLMVSSAPPPLVRVAASSASSKSIEDPTYFLSGLESFIYREILFDDPQTLWDAFCLAKSYEERWRNPFSEISKPQLSSQIKIQIHRSSSTKIPEAATNPDLEIHKTRAAQRNAVANSQRQQEVDSSEIQNSEIQKVQLRSQIRNSNAKSSNLEIQSSQINRKITDPSEIQNSVQETQSQLILTVSSSVAVLSSDDKGGGAGNHVEDVTATTGERTLAKAWVDGVQTEENNQDLRPVHDVDEVGTCAEVSAPAKGKWTGVVAIATDGGLRARQLRRLVLLTPPPSPSGCIPVESRRLWRRMEQRLLAGERGG